MKVTESSTKVQVTNYDVKVITNGTLNSVIDTKTSFKAITGESFSVISSTTKTIRKVELFSYYSKVAVSITDITKVQIAIKEAFIATRTGML